MPAPGMGTAFVAQLLEEGAIDRQLAVGRQAAEDMLGTDGVKAQRRQATFQLSLRQAVEQPAGQAAG